jgi:hypothetical protein
MADLERERQRLDRHWQQRLERAQIETNRAARQYHAVEPENRLVVRELERRWEEALRDQRELQEQHDRFLAERPRELTVADRQRIEALAADIPGLWHAPRTTIQERQQIVRCLVERITVAVRGESEWVDVTICWAGGLESRHEIRRSVRKYEQLSNYEALRDRMVELRRAGLTTTAIAEQLNRDGFYPSRGPDRFYRTLVQHFLKRKGLMGLGAIRRAHPENFQPDEWTLRDLAGELGMPGVTLRSWLNRGWVRARRSGATGGDWILWADARERERLRRLRAWHGDGHVGVRPSKLTTPRTPRAQELHPSVRTAQRSGCDSPSSKMRLHD